MAKKKGKQKQHEAAGQASPTAERQDGGAGPPAKMKRGVYEGEMRVLQGELVAMQEWVKASGAKVCVVFEGRDTAGKGACVFSGRYRLASGRDDLAPEVVDAFLNLLTAGGPVEPRSRRCGGCTVRRR